MKNMATLLSVYFVVLSCKTYCCDTISITCFTHYQINQADEVIIGTDKLPPFLVYDEPNGKVIFNLPPDEDFFESGWEIDILEEKYNFFKIKNIWGIKYAETQSRRYSIPKNKVYGYNIDSDWMSDYEYVWIEKGSVGLNIDNYDNQKVPLFSRSNTESEIVGHIENAQTVIVLDACKD